MSRFTLLLVLASALLAGCATPDLQPFAQETARLAGAIAEEQRQIAQQFERVSVLGEQACEKEKRAAALPDPPEAARPSACEIKAQRDKEAPSYAESRRIIDGLLDKAAAYAATLAELAAAGETGGEAAQSLLTSVKEFGSLVGVGGSVVSATVADTLGKIATAVTRVQAQRSLAEATAAAQEPISVVANGVRELHAPSDDIAGVLQRDERTLLLRLAGRDLVGLFQDAALNREAMIARRLRAPVIGELLGCGTGGGDKAKCAQLQNAVRSADELGRLLEQLRPDYEAYQRELAAVNRWRDERRQNLTAISKAMEAWKMEHARVAEALKRCGGLNAVRCARIDAASLRKVVDEINEIRSLRGR